VGDVREPPVRRGGLGKEKNPSPSSKQTKKWRKKSKLGRRRNGVRLAARSGCKRIYKKMARAFDV